jgi:replicative DNA helicase
MILLPREPGAVAPRTGRPGPTARSVAAIFDELGTARVGPLPPTRYAMPTGFQPLDSVLGGGLFADNLYVLGGRPGVGKTVAALQWARSVAMAGHVSVLASYEHSEAALLARLLLLELGSLSQPEDVPFLDGLRAVVRDFAFGAIGLDVLLAHDPLLQVAHACLRAYADRLVLVSASSASTGVDELRALVVPHALDGATLFVDYLQKVAHRGFVDEHERVTAIAGGLKDLALDEHVAVVAVSAVDHQGIQARRVRLRDLRGSTALAYECDTAILVNDKLAVASKVHAAYDLSRIPEFRHISVLTVEKNRDGTAAVDMEFRKQFATFRFDPDGSFSIDHLIDDLVFES